MGEAVYPEDSEIVEIKFFGGIEFSFCDAGYFDPMGFKKMLKINGVPGDAISIPVEDNEIFIGSGGNFWNEGGQK